MSAKSNIMASNPKASHNYKLEKAYTAGLVLEGWEAAAIKNNRLSLQGSFVSSKNGELYLSEANISPLDTSAQHIKTDPLRLRKLLLNKKEINDLIKAVERKGYTLVPTAVIKIKNRYKLEFSIGKGKNSVDKRHSQKDADWGRQKERLNKQN